MSKTYCEHCNMMVGFTTKDNQNLYDEMLKVKYLGTTCSCKICGSEVYDDDVELFNIKKANHQYKKTLQKIS